MEELGSTRAEHDASAHSIRRFRYRARGTLAREPLAWNTIPRSRSEIGELLRNRRVVRFELLGKYSECIQGCLVHRLTIRISVSRIVTLQHAAGGFRSSSLPCSAARFSAAFSLPTLRPHHAAG